MHDESGGADRSGTQRSGFAPEVVQIGPLQTVPLSEDHRIADFKCPQSERINGFFANECLELVKHRYCRVFILPNREDRTGVWGFYTLSPSLLLRDRATGSDQKRIPGGLPVPMMLIGFMGRDDGAPKGLGESLIVDAARRVYVNPDLAAWGLMLDSEGGPNNAKLWAWYKKQGFVPAKADPDKPDPNRGVMYTPLKRLIPELGTGQSHRAVSDR
jgi:hypothetical protein